MPEIELIDLIDLLVIVMVFAGFVYFLQINANEDGLKAEAYSADIAVMINNMIGVEGGISSVIKLDERFFVKKSGNYIIVGFENNKTVSRVINRMIGKSNVKELKHAFLDNNDYKITVEQKKDIVKVEKRK
jgi:hypothetical protein